MNGKRPPGTWAEVKRQAFDKNIFALRTYVLDEGDRWNDELFNLRTNKENIFKALENIDDPSYANEDFRRFTQILTEVTQVVTNLSDGEKVSKTSFKYDKELWRNLLFDWHIINKMKKILKRTDTYKPLPLVIHGD